MAPLPFLLLAGGGAAGQALVLLHDGTPLSWGGFVTSRGFWGKLRKQKQECSGPSGTEL